MKSLRQCVIEKCENFPELIINGGQPATVQSINEDTGWIKVVYTGRHESLTTLITYEDIHS